MPKISVIVPAFNAEKYLVNCLESVMGQTYKDIELVVINDGSSDNTISIIKSYQSEHKNIILVDKQNSGVSDTRNIGIDNSTGEYLMFLDSDDTILPNYIERHFSEMKNDVDMVISKLSFEPIGEQNCKVDTYEALYQNRKLPWAFPFCKLLKAEIVKNHNIRFNKDINLCEDWMFVMDYIRYVRKIAVINYAGYIWNTDNGASLSRGCTYEYRLEAYEIALKHLEEMHYFKGIKADNLYEVIRKDNYIRAINRMYVIHTPACLRRERLWKYYERYSSNNFEKLLNRLGILPIWVDLKRIAKSEIKRIIRK